MLENETAEMLNTRYQNMVKNKTMEICLYFDEYPDIEKCNFEKLQQLCKDKGFFIYKLNESPIDKKDCRKAWNVSHGIILYSNYSLTLIKKFDKKDLYW